MRILNLGSKAAFSVVESAVSLFIVSVLLIAVFAFSSTTKKYEEKITKNINAFLEYQNEYSEKNK